MDANKSSQKVPTEVSSVAGRELASHTKEREAGWGRGEAVAKATR